MQKAIEMLNRRRQVLRGMLHVPENADSKVPIVAIYHGFTGNKMEPHFIFVKLSRALEKKGIASVRFDFAGSGESDGEFIDMTISGEISDALDILDYARSLEFVDTARTGIVGLSLGGAIASSVAGTQHDKIKTLVLWAPAGNELRGIKNNSDPVQAKSFEENGYIDLNGFVLGKGFIDDLANVDIYADAMQYDKKVLIVHGSGDQIVPLQISSKDYAAIYGDRMKLHVIKNADHTFNKKEWEEEAIGITVKYLANAI
jgi:alpha/beta superfamily hydrolase